MTEHLPLLTAVSLVWLAVYVWIAAALSAVFAKAGEQAWQAWVPLYNLVVLLRLGQLSAWWLLLLLLPGLGSTVVAVVVWIACHRINRHFGVGAGMTVLAILLFPVWASVLGWGSARWIGRGPSRPSSPAYRPPASSAPAGPRVAASAPAARSGASPAYGPPAVRTPPAPAGYRPAAPAPAASVVPPAPAGFGRPAPTASVQSPPAGAYPPGALRAPRPQPAAGPPPEPPRPPLPPAAAAAPAAPTVRGPDEDTGSVTDVGTPGAPGPLRAPGHVSGQSAAAPDPWAPPSAPVVRTPRYSPVPGEGGGFETSAAVSAVQGAPFAGVPRSARAAVSAQQAEPSEPAVVDDAPDDGFDETVIATRRRVAWVLTPPLGAPVPITSDVLIIGRRPGADPAHPEAQLVSITDETRTMSKTHARLELRDDRWSIVDLDSTNGVTLVDPDGAEHDVTPGRAMPVGDVFLLGDARLSIAHPSSAA